MSLAHKQAIRNRVWSVISRVRSQQNGGPSVYGRNGCPYSDSPQLWLILGVAQESSKGANRMRSPAESFTNYSKGLGEAGRACGFLKEL